MQRLIILLCLFCFCGVTKAQQINLDKAEAAIVDSFYERAYKLTTEALEDEKTKKDPLTYYLRGFCLFQLSKQAYFVKKNPEAFKDACKMVLKGKEKDKEKQYIERFTEFVIDIVLANNALAEEEYKINKYAKAIKLYNLSYNMNGDTTAYFMIGKSYQLAADTVNAIFYYKSLVNSYIEKSRSGLGNSNPYIDPFLFLSDYHWAKKHYDSANYYLDMARVVFGNNNSKVNFYQYLISKEQIASQPPSTLMMESIRKAMNYSPADTFLIRKENALAMYLIRNAVDAAKFTDADSMLFRFAREKAVRANNPAYESLKEVDIFLQPLSENVIWKVCDYYYVNTHDKASTYCAKKYIIRTATANDAAIPTQKEIIARWVKIIEFVKENEPAGFVSLLLNQALTDNPTSKELLELKKKLLIK